MLYQCLYFIRRDARESKHLPSVMSMHRVTIIIIIDALVFTVSLPSYSSPRRFGSQADTMQSNHIAQPMSNSCEIREIILLSRLTKSLHAFNGRIAAIIFVRTASISSFHLESSMRMSARLQMGAYYSKPGIIMLSALRCAMKVLNRSPE